MEDRIKKLREGQKASILGAVGTILIAILKIAVGELSGSIALIADAIHDLSDSIVTLVAWAGLRIAERRPTEKFPYGYYKAENFATFLISLLFLYGGFEVLKESWAKLFSKVSISYAGIALIVPVISAIYGWIISGYFMKVGKRMYSQSLIAISKETKIHIIVAISVFIGILCSYLQIPFVEALVGVGIAFLIFRIAAFTAKDSLYSLMDVSPGEEIEEKIKDVLSSMPSIKEFYDLRVRRSGPFILGEVKLRVKGSIDVKRAHEISDIIEHRLKEEIPNLDSFTIHIEPWEKEMVKLAIPAMNTKGLDSRISDVTSRAKYFVFVDVDRKKKSIVSLYVKENTIRKRKTRTGLALARVMKEERVNAIVVRQIGDIAFHSLRDSFITVYLTKREKVSEALEDYINGRLEALLRPTKRVS